MSKFINAFLILFTILFAVAALVQLARVGSDAIEVYNTKMEEAQR